MRSTINLKPYIQKKIISQHNECYERLRDYLFHTEQFDDTFLTLSTYDHCLTEEEAAEKLVDGHVDHPLYYQRIFDFFVYLNENFDAYLVKLKGRSRNKLAFKKVLVPEKCLRPVSFLASGQHHIRLIIPSLEMVIAESWDFTIYVSAPLKSKSLIAKEALKFKIYDIG